MFTTQIDRKPFTPFRIEDAQYATPSPLITAHKVGVLNEKRCKSSPSGIGFVSLAVMEREECESALRIECFA
jgi:hypothetical protein